MKFSPNPKPEPRKPKEKKPLNKKRKPTGEKEIFLEVWNERPHICTNYKTNLGNEPLAHYFAHIISKKREPRLRLIKDNIRLLCMDCHYIYDFGTKEQFNKLTK